MILIAIIIKMVIIREVFIFYMHVCCCWSMILRVSFMLSSLLLVLALQHLEKQILVFLYHSFICCFLLLMVILISTNSRNTLNLCAREQLQKGVHFLQLRLLFCWPTWVNLSGSYVYLHWYTHEVGLIGELYKLLDIFCEIKQAYCPFIL